jgi:proteasome lid subunit RPN8/RPN11
MKLRMTLQLWKKIEKHARESFPNECVGFYLGTGEKVEEVKGFKNIAEEKGTSSEISRKELKKLTGKYYKLNAQFGEEWFWFGQYHSHPTTGQTIQSKLDKAAGKRWQEYRRQIILGIQKKDGRVKRKFYYYDVSSRRWEEGKIIVGRKKA